LDEGVDVPATRTAFLLASTTNPREFIQRRGRILRLAEGKPHASIYDFLVMPLGTTDAVEKHVNRGLLKREMPRFAEFASLSLNEFQARRIVRDLLNKYEMLHLLDEKPWDMYHRLRMEKGFDLPLQ
jgi:superfamily II DNA or RNA helicase